MHSSACRALDSLEFGRDMWQYLIIQSKSVSETLECQISHAGVTLGTSALLCLYFTPFNVVDDGFMSCVCALSLSLSFSLSQLSRLPARLQGLCQPCSLFLLMPPWSTFTVNLCITHVASHCAFHEQIRKGDLIGQTVKYAISVYLLVVHAKASVTIAQIYEFELTLSFTF